MKLGWKTITGGLLYGIGIASQPDVLAILPPQAGGLVQAIGVVLAALGIRHAIAKR